MFKWKTSGAEVRAIVHSMGEIANAELAKLVLWNDETKKVCSDTMA